MLETTLLNPRLETRFRATFDGLFEAGHELGLHGGTDHADAIRARSFALMYGHPFVEGVRADLIERIVREVKDTHEVVTVGEYLARWRECRDCR